jgi:hypothetical protein
MDTLKKNKSKGTTPHKKKTGNMKLQITELKQSIAAMQSELSKVAPTQMSLTMLVTP